MKFRNLRQLVMLCTQEFDRTFNTVEFVPVLVHILVHRMKPWSLIRPLLVQE